MITCVNNFQFNIVPMCIESRDMTLCGFEFWSIWHQKPSPKNHNPHRQEYQSVHGCIKTHTIILQYQKERERAGKNNNYIIEFYISRQLNIKLPDLSVTMQTIICYALGYMYLVIPLWNYNFH